MSAGHKALKISLLDDFQLINPSLPAGRTINVFWIFLQVLFGVSMYQSPRISLSSCCLLSRDGVGDFDSNT